MCIRDVKTHFFHRSRALSKRAQCGRAWPDIARHLTPRCTGEIHWKPQWLTQIYIFECTIFTLLCINAFAALDHTLFSLCFAVALSNGEILKRIDYDNTDKNMQINSLILFSVIRNGIFLGFAVKLGCFELYDGSFCLFWSLWDLGAREILNASVQNIDGGQILKHLL